MASSSSPKASKALKIAKGDPWSQMVKIKSDIDFMEKKLEAKKVQLRKLAAKL